MTLRLCVLRYDEDGAIIVMKTTTKNKIGCKQSANDIAVVCATVSRRWCCNCWFAGDSLPNVTTCVRAHIYTYIKAHTHIHILTRAPTLDITACVRTHMHTHMCLHIYVYAYTYINVHIFVHTHMYTHATQRWRCNCGFASKPTY